MRVATYIMQGYSLYYYALKRNEELKPADNCNHSTAFPTMSVPVVKDILYNILLQVTKPDMYAFKEVYLMESILLMIHQGILGNSTDGSYSDNRITTGYGHICKVDKPITELILLCFVLLLGVNNRTVNEGGNSCIGSASSSTTEGQVSSSVGITTTGGGNAGTLYNATYQ